MESIHDIIKQEEENIKKAVDLFCKRMKAKMLLKRRQGFVGWDNKRYKDVIQRKLLRNLANNDYIDVANLAMMLDGFKKK